MDKLRVTFGIIVLNGEPFTRYNLRALYPFAHQIIVVEGACPGSHAIASQEGHSTDGTLEALRQFCQEEDHDGKICVITAEDEGKPNGFWQEKDEMSQAYAKRATGNLLWQIDVDEFYQPHDMESILAILESDSELKMVTFKQITFWGDLDTWVDGFLLRRDATMFRRLFRWAPNYKYSCHRPPTVLDDAGYDLSRNKVLRGDYLAEIGIFLYHYSLLLPKQVENKTLYYENAQWCQARGAGDWGLKFSRGMTDPFHVHNCAEYISWLEEFHGEHPPEIKKMWNDIATGKLGITRRKMDDAKGLMRRPWFRFCRAVLRLLSPLDSIWYRAQGAWARFRRCHGIFREGPTDQF